MLREVFQLFEGYLLGGDKHILFALLVCFLVMWETVLKDATPKRREGGLWVQFSISKADAFVLKKKKIHEWMENLLNNDSYARKLIIQENASFLLSSLTG